MKQNNSQGFRHDEELTERIMLIGHIANLQQEVQDLLESAKTSQEA